MGGGEGGMHVGPNARASFAMQRRASILRRTHPLQPFSSLSCLLINRNGERTSEPFYLLTYLVACM